jgi:AraC family transcriptional regulator, regulatory protein of adaptative response / methylated-DNA-[protein]-cysteine methyltransferase
VGAWSGGSNDPLAKSKRLLDQTELSMAEIAMRSGFGSPWRFNAVFAEVYRRRPTQIRSVKNARPR